MVVAGIVTFNPDIDRLASNIFAIASSVSKILIVDNNSANLEAIEKLLEQSDRISLVANESNLGISVALNQITSWALEGSEEWVLLLDQDSVGSAEMVRELTMQEDSSIAVLAPKVVDRNLGKAPEHAQSEDVDYCITSGSLLNVSAWRAVGGYDPQLFIDFVDFDLCLRLRQAGYRLRRVASAELLHEIGDSRRYGPFVAYNHSAARSLHLASDMVYYAKKHASADPKLKVKGRGLVGTYVVLARRILIVLAFESDRRRRSTAIVRGAIRGSLLKPKYIAPRM